MTMRLLILVFLVGAFICLLEAKPFQTSANGLYLVEGDMLLTMEQQENYNHYKNGRVRRAALKDRYLWPDGIVYYTFDSSLNQKAKTVAKNAMEQWSGSTCLQFKERPASQRGYVTFMLGNRRMSPCSAQLGYTGSQQNINMGTSTSDICKAGSVTHEIGHAIGFFHEHQRQDRDEHIEINRKNIVSGAERNFNKADARYLDSRGHDYDFGSIMHYSRYQGNNKYNAVVIQAKPPNQDIEYGQRNAPSEGDIAQINDMYNCARKRGIARKKIKYDGGKGGTGKTEVAPAKSGDGPMPGDILE